MFDDFSEVLSEVDVLLMLEVFASSESPIAGADSRALCRSIRQRGAVDPIFVSDQTQITKLINDIVQEGDILLTQGAGVTNKVAAQLAQHFMPTIPSVSARGHG